MKCPVCPNAVLSMSDRQGIEIDFCPDCRGVWLDRGELDKIIERSMPEVSAPAPEASRDPRDDRGRRDRDRDRDRDDRDRDRDDDRYYKRKKRKSFFSELFDFD